MAQDPPGPRSQATAGHSPAAEPNAGEEEEQELEEDEDEEDESLLYNAYIPQKVNEGVAHPTKIVETASLAATEPPAVRYEHKLQDIVERGLVSGPQIETLVYANMRFNAPQGIWVRNLSSGAMHRPGFFLADGAGVGKGRQIAALVAEHWRRGGRRVLWLSVSTDLKEDTIRDLNALGLEGTIPVHPRDKSLPSAPKRLASHGVQEGVVFGTYALLISGSTNTKERSKEEATDISLITEDFLGDGVDSRLKQIVEWLRGTQDAKAAEPLIVMDECHKAKNLINKAGSPTQTGKAVVVLQDALPKAKIVYSSATGASEPHNLAYMTRLGTWGYDNMEKFVKSIELGGLAAMEMLAISLKSMGIYVSRALSFDGAEFQLTELSFTDEQAVSYDRSAAFWQFLWKVFKACKPSSGGHPKHHRAYKVANACFWGAHLRFFKTMLVAAKVPKLCKKVNKAIAHGHCCVIGLQSTGEASAKHMKLQEGDEVDDLISAPRVVLLNLVKKFLPTVAKFLDEKDVQELFVMVKRQLDEWKDAWAAPVGPNNGRRGGGSSRGLDRISVRPGDFKAEWEAVKREEEAEVRAAEARAQAEDAASAGGDLVALDSLVNPLSLGKKRPTSARRPLGALGQNTLDGDNGSKRPRSDNTAAPGARGGAAAAPDEGPPREEATEAVVDLTGDSGDEGVEVEAEEVVEEDDVELLLPATLKKKQQGESKAAAAAAAAAAAPAAAAAVEGSGGSAEGGTGEEETSVIDLMDSDSDEEVQGVEAAAQVKHEQTKQEEEQQGWRAHPTVLAQNAAEDNKGKGPAITPLHSPSAGASDGSGASGSGAAQNPRAAQDFFMEISDSDDEEEDDGGRAAPGRRGAGAGGRRTQGSRRAAPLEEGWDEGVERPEVDAIVKMLHKGIEALELPANPLDEITAECGGAENVAELTGRCEHLLKDEEGGACKFSRRVDDVAPDKVNLAEMQSFMDGRKLVAIISDAGSTGISLHADRGAGNQRRRVHFTLELPWSADKAIQQFGRSHRSNQASAPIYDILITKCGGERRFASCAAKRLQSLGALTKGDRRAMGAGNDLKSFDIDTNCGEQALRRIFRDIKFETDGPMGGVEQPKLPLALQAAFDDGTRRVSRQAEGEIMHEHPETAAFYTHMQACLQTVDLMAAEEDDEPEGDDGDRSEDGGSPQNKKKPKKPPPPKPKLDRFLNRLLGLSVDEQDCLFRYFEDTYTAEVMAAKARGEWSTGMMTIKGFTSLERISRTVLHKDPSTEATVYVSRLKGDMRILWADARVMMLENKRACQQGNHPVVQSIGFFKFTRPRSAKNSHSTLFGSVRKPHVALVKYIIPPNEVFPRTDPSKFKFELIKPWGAAFPVHGQTKLEEDWVRIDDEEEAKGLWERYYSLTERTCRHGDTHCWRRDKGETCIEGMRQNFYVVEGAILPIWGTLVENQRKLLDSDKFLVHKWRMATKKDIGQWRSPKKGAKKMNIFPLVKADLVSPGGAFGAGGGDGGSVLGVALTEKQIKALRKALAEKKQAAAQAAAEAKASANAASVPAALAAAAAAATAAAAAAAGTPPGGHPAPPGVGAWQGHAPAEDAPIELI